MMPKSIFLHFALMAAVFTTTSADATSMSCVYINGVPKCVSNTNKDSNMAGAAAGIRGDSGMIAAGTGKNGIMDVNSQQIGNGANSGDAGGVDNQPGGYGDAGGNAGYPPFVGTYPGGVVAVSGGGYPNNPAFPQWNGNPFDFVNNFFRGFGGRR